MLLKLLVVKITLLLVFNSSQGRNSCDQKEAKFKCLNNNCISIFQRCDDVDHCGDFSDELDCVCRGWFMGKMFQCANRKCINVGETCNFRDDCGDGSDEIGCICLEEHHFKCRNKRCIEKRRKCNSFDDCGDGSDEENCECSSESYNCTSVKCLSSIVKCNGKNECGDDSDEKDCPCPQGGKRCTNGRCISEVWWCNGNEDCADGSDEKNCDSCALQDFNFATCFNEVYGNISIYEYLILRYPYQIFFFTQPKILFHPLFNLQSYLFNQTLMCPHLVQLKTCLSKYSVNHCEFSYRLSIPRTLETLDKICYSTADEPQYAELIHCLIHNIHDQVSPAISNCSMQGTKLILENQLLINTSSNCSIFTPYLFTDACMAQVLSEQVPMCGTFDYFLRHFKIFSSNVPTQCIDYDLLCDKSSVFSENLCKNSSTFPRVNKVLLRGPDVINNKVQFYCVFMANLDNNAKYNITFVINGYLAIYSIEVGINTRNATLSENKFASHLGKILSCRVESYYSFCPHLTNTVSSNNNYYLGVLAYPTMTTLREKERTSFDLKFYSTLPFLCSANNYCDLNYNLVTGFGLAIESKICFRTLHVLPTIVNPLYQPNYKFYLRDNVKLTTTLEINLLNFGTAVSGKISSKNFHNSTPNYFMNHTFKPFIVSRKDRLQEIGQYQICTVSVHTNVLTFDYLLYYSFSQGIFSYVKTFDHSLEIQLIHNKSIVCGVAVREGFVILIADACMDGIPIFLTHPFTDLPFGYSIKPPLNNAFKLNTPSSAIYVTKVFEGGINVIIYLKETFSEKVSGLCGNYDGNPYNDIPISNSSYLKKTSNSRLPTYSLDLYSVHGNESLFFGETKAEKKLAENLFCRCRKESDDFDAKNICSGALNTFSSQEDFYNAPKSPSFDFMYTIMNAKETGFRSLVDYEGYPSGYIYPPYLKYQENFLKNLETKTFLQDFQFDQTFALETCKEYFNTLRHGLNCSIYDLEKYLVLEKCSLDVQVSRNVSATSYSTPELLKICQINYSSSNYILNPHKNLNPFLSENQAIEHLASKMLELENYNCKRFCLFGVCKLGRCICTESFIGQNCDLSNNSIPEIKRVINKDYIDYRSPSRFHEVVVELSGASDSHSDVICFIIVHTLEEKKVVESSTIAFSRGSLFSCPIDSVLTNAFIPRYEGNILKSKGTPIIKITVEFVNRNLSFSGHLSNNATVTAFDSRCIQCISTNCVLKKDTCLIDGYCYVKNQANFMDHSKTCQPTKANDSFESVAKAASSIFTLFPLYSCLVARILTN